VDFSEYGNLQTLKAFFINFPISKFLYDAAYLAINYWRKLMITQAKVTAVF